MNQGRSKDHIPRETASAPSTRPPRVPVPPPAPWRWPVGEAPQHRGQDAWRRAARGGCSRASGGPRPQRSAALAPAPPRASRPQRCRRRPPQQGEPALRAEEGQGGRPREARRCCPAPAPQGWGRARRAPAPCSTSRTGRGLPGRGWGGSSSGVTGTLSASARGAAPPSAPSLRRAFRPRRAPRASGGRAGPRSLSSAVLGWTTCCCLPTGLRPRGGETPRRLPAQGPPRPEPQRARHSAGGQESVSTGVRSQLPFTEEDALHNASNSGAAHTQDRFALQVPCRAHKL